MGIRTLDLFCGGGGSSWGAKAAGARIVCGVDGWPVASATYGRNFPKAHAVNMMLTEDTRPDEIGTLGKIDLLLASPECTHHTCARGARPADESSKRTARYVVNFAADLKPRWLVIENVIHMKGWQGYLPLLSELTALGYKTRVQTIDSKAFGVPQSRKRLFVMCDLLREPPPVIGRPGRPLSARSVLDPEGTWASRPLYSPKRAQATIERAERGIAELGAGHPFLIVYYGSDGSGGWQSLSKPLRTITTIDRFGLVTWDGETPMLRMLQPIELARAMGFGESFTLGDGTRREKIMMIGNSVAPPVMQTIIETLTGPGEVLQDFLTQPRSSRPDRSVTQSTWVAQQP